MKILLVSSGDPRNRSSWSGTSFSIYSALKNYANEPVTFSSKPVLIGFLSSIVSTVTRKTADFYKTKCYSKYLARKVEKIIAIEKPDIIIGVVATVELAYVKTNIPIIHISDATYMNLYEYHPHYLRVWDWSKNKSNHLEQLIINSAKFVILPSQWASKSAIDDYGCTQEKIKIIPFGANLEVTTQLPKKLSVGINKPCKLLFVGLDWRYKGGPIALSTMQSLRNRGIDARLQIIGCKPPSHISSPYMNVKPFLDKNDPEDYRELTEHFSNSTFLIVPTLADAIGIVFAEAAMHGLPSISHATGGVKSVIDHEKTGFLLPIGSNGNDFADVIEQTLNDNDKYQVMSKDAYLKYKKQLNWRKWQNSLKEIIDTCIS